MPAHSKLSAAQIFAFPVSVLFSYQAFSTPAVPISNLRLPTSPPFRSSSILHLPSGFPLRCFTLRSFSSPAPPNFRSSAVSSFVLAERSSIVHRAVTVHSSPFTIHAVRLCSALSIQHPRNYLHSRNLVPPLFPTSALRPFSHFVPRPSDLSRCSLSADGSDPPSFLVLRISAFIYSP